LLAFAPYDITRYIIPNSVTEIEEGAFSNCSNLTSIIIPNSVTVIRRIAFYNCDSLTSITIPDSVTEIGETAFSHCCKAFYGKYASHDNRCLIKDGILLAFAPAPYDITKYTIPNSVTAIERCVFSRCWNLTSVTIPDSVTKIGTFAFDNCRSLTSVYCKATTPPKLGLGTFVNNKSDRKIYVPKSEGSTLLKAYKSAEGWKDYADSIEEYDFDNE
jgi:hypothetical protein